MGPRYRRRNGHKARGHGSCTDLHTYQEIKITNHVSSEVAAKKYASVRDSYFSLQWRYGLVSRHTSGMGHCSSRSLSHTVRILSNRESVREREHPKRIPNFRCLIADDRRVFCTNLQRIRIAELVINLFQQQYGHSSKQLCE